MSIAKSRATKNSTSEPASPLPFEIDHVATDQNALKYHIFDKSPEDEAEGKNVIERIVMAKLWR